MPPLPLSYRRRSGAQANFVEEITMDIHPCGAAPSRRASAEYFTGTVWQDPIIETPAPGHIRATVVRFEPAARTNWHTHPVGQTLYILSGAGRVQRWDGPIREVRAGDVVWFQPGEKHWHGAAPIAITETADEKYIAWLEKVTDEQYQQAAQKTAG
jgi:quercetin dioxygenase-like cupin family protein